MWNSIAGTMVVEVLLFAAGIWLYVSATRARVGRYAFLGYIAFLVLLYASDACSGAPPSITAIAWAGIVAPLILIPWAWWFDHHRVAR